MAAIVLAVVAAGDAQGQTQCWDCVALPGDSTGMATCHPVSGGGYLTCQDYCQDNWCICIPSGYCAGFAYLAPTPEGAIVFGFTAAEQLPRAALAFFSACEVRFGEGAWWTATAVEDSGVRQTRSTVGVTNVGASDELLPGIPGGGTGRSSIRR